MNKKEYYELSEVDKVYFLEQCRDLIIRSYDYNCYDKYYTEFLGCRYMFPFTIIDLVGIKINELIANEKNISEFLICHYVMEELYKGMPFLLLPKNKELEFNLRFTFNNEITHGDPEDLIDWMNDNKIYPTYTIEKDRLEYFEKYMNPRDVTLSRLIAYKGVINR